MLNLLKIKLIFYIINVLSFLNDNFKISETKTIIIPIESKLNEKLLNLRIIKIKGERYLIKKLSESEFIKIYNEISLNININHILEIEVNGNNKIIKKDNSNPNLMKITHKVYIIEAIGCGCCNFVKELGKRSKNINKIFESKDTLTALQEAAHPGKKRTWNLNN